MKETLIIILAFWLVAFSDNRSGETNPIDKLSDHIDTSVKRYANDNLITETIKQYEKNNRKQ